MIYSRLLSGNGEYKKEGLKRGQNQTTQHSPAFYNSVPYIGFHLGFVRQTGSGTHPRGNQRVPGVSLSGGMARRKDCSARLHIALATRKIHCRTRSTPFRTASARRRRTSQSCSTQPCSSFVRRRTRLFRDHPMERTTTSTNHQSRLRGYSIILW